MAKIALYTILTIFIVDLMATCGDINLTWTSPVLPKLYSNSSVNPLGRPITPYEESWISSFLMGGAMLGPIPYSFLSDRIGRKYTLLTIAVPFLISFILLSSATSVTWYYIARLLAGTSLGGSYTVLPTYIAEIAEDSNRGTLSVAINVFWVIGDLIPYVIGPYISIFGFNLILAVLPTLFFVLFLILGPESPYFLLKNHKREEAEIVLKKLRGNESNVDKEITHILESQQNDKSGKFSDLFVTRTNRKALRISLLLIMFQQLSGIGAILFYTQMIFDGAGTSLPPEISSIIVGVVLLIASLFTPLFAHKFGRKFFLLGSGLGTTLALAVFGGYFYCKDTLNLDVSGVSWLPVVSLMFYIVTYAPGLSGVTWTVINDILPVNIKTSGASLAAIMSRLTGFVVTKFFNDFNYYLGSGGTFWMFGGCCFAAFIYIYFCVPETKGKSFKEIQEILERREKK